MKYDTTKLTVKAGKKIKLTFANPDFLPHNIVLVNPAKPRPKPPLPSPWAPKASKPVVPPSSDVIWASKLIDHGKEQVIEFTALSKPGEYPYVCTFPGHAMMMRGVLTVKQHAEPTQSRPPRAPSRPRGESFCVALRARCNQCIDERRHRAIGTTFASRNFNRMKTKPHSPALPPECRHDRHRAGRRPWARPVRPATASRSGSLAPAPSTGVTNCSSANKMRR